MRLTNYDWYCSDVNDLYLRKTDPFEFSNLTFLIELFILLYRVDINITLYITAYAL